MASDTSGSGKSWPIKVSFEVNLELENAEEFEAVRPQLEALAKFQNKEDLQPSAEPPEENCITGAEREGSTSRDEMYTCDVHQTPGLPGQPGLPATEVCGYTVHYDIYVEVTRCLGSGRVTYGNTYQVETGRTPKQMPPGCS